MNPSQQRLKSVAIVILISAWFLGHTYKGLRIYFTGDDLMNMYGAWVLPLPKLLIANLTPFTSVYRPVGSLLYRFLYLSAGLNPLPFRIVAYALMMLNIWLLFRVARILTGSTEIAVLAALIFSYHRRLMDLFLNDGTIYDILCFTFYCLTLIYYISVRQKQGTVAGRHLLGFCVLFTLALNSKEMAFTLPVILLAYELIYHAPSIKAMPRWFYDRHALWIAALMTAVAIKTKLAPAGPFAGNSGYALTVSVKQFFDTTIPFLNHLFFLPDPDNGFSRTGAVALFVLLWAIAIATRNKVLLLAAVMIVVMPIPVNFIVYRGFFVMYLPLLGWTLYLATMLVLARDWLRSFVSTRQPERAGLFVATAFVLFTIQSRDRFWTFDRVDPAQPLIRQLKESLVRIRPSMPKNGSVLFLGDPFSGDEGWDPVFVVRLLYRSPDIAVDRVKAMGPGAQRRDAYSLVLDYNGHGYDVAR